MSPGPESMMAVTVSGREGGVSVVRVARRPPFPRGLAPTALPTATSPPAPTLPSSTLLFGAMASPAARKRLSKEYAAMQKTPPPFAWAVPDEKVRGRLSLHLPLFPLLPFAEIPPS